MAWAGVPVMPRAIVPAMLASHVVHGGEFLFEKKWNLMIIEIILFLIALLALLLPTLFGFSDRRGIKTSCRLSVDLPLGFNQSLLWGVASLRARRPRKRRLQANAPATARAGTGPGTGSMRNTPGTGLLALITSEPADVG